MDSKLENALKIMEITDGKICDHCLGRKFSNEVEGPGNPLRGEKISKMLLQNDITFDKNSKCAVCHDIFFDINEELAENVAQKIKDLNLEFDGFVVGSKLAKEVVEKDQSLNQELGLEVESLKKEVNRELGKLLEISLHKEADFDNPHLVIMVDFKKEIPSVRIQINPLFLEGRYRKLIRGIPQTKWPCRKCKGRGCEECNFTGKMYTESVEELISPHALKITRGRSSKFHGAGREDIDVRMLGTGRPFVLEIKEPRQRTIDLEKLTHRINQESEGKIEVLQLKYSIKARKASIKTSSPDTFKTYQAQVELKDPVSLEKLENLQSMNIINQRTPLRVSHRRADKVRIREVKSIEAKIINSYHIELIIKGQGGLYIKELISGDDGRTSPNVSDVLGTPASCVQLDVLEVQG
ncbi:MAG: tRNA pseudouridine(54/55) synthase Pus10 [Euryarchaeota archaeon]